MFTLQYFLKNCNSKVEIHERSSIFIYMDLKYINISDLMQS